MARTIRSIPRLAPGAWIVLHDDDHPPELCRVISHDDRGGLDAWSAECGRFSTLDSMFDIEVLTTDDRSNDD